MTKSKTETEKPEPLSLNRRELTVLLASVFAMSFAILAFEISLTRVFSTMFAYHYAFLAIAISFAGLGIGGIFSSYLFSEYDKKELFVGLATSAAMFAFLTSLFILGISGSSTASPVGAAILFFISSMPAGVFFAKAYCFFSQRSNVVYGTDIIGASFGSLAVITIMSSINPLTAVLAISTVITVISVFLAAVVSKRGILGAMLVLLLLVTSMQFAATYYAKDVILADDQAKEMAATLQDPASGARVIDSRWGQLGRTDLVQLQSDPHTKIIFVDGGAGTSLYHFTGNFEDNNTEVGTLASTTAAYPFYFAGKGDSLIIGPGAGKDVLIELMFDVSHIHAVEINENTVDIVKDYSSFDGGIYTDYTNVHVHVDEGRSYLKRTEATYDSILLNIPITKTIQGSTGYSMAESYLFTTDSFKDFLNHLNNDGYLIIVAHQRFELYKLVTTVLEALIQEEVENRAAMKQLVAAEMGGHSMFPVFILKKQPFSLSEASVMFDKAVELGLRPLYFPNSNATVKQSLDPNLISIEEGTSDAGKLISLAAENQLNLNPATDDNPFFYSFEAGLPSTLPPLLTGFTVLAVFATIAYLALGAHRISMPTKKQKDPIHSKFSIFMPYYFASIGTAFMLIEVALIQKFMLFLGPPALTMASILFSLLFAMGLSGLTSKKWKQPLTAFKRIPLLVGLVIIGYVFTLPLIFPALLSLDLTMRLMVTFALTFPAGFLLGMPFPLGLRILEQRYEGADASWMYGINGIYSLLGSTLAVAVSMLSGFTVSLLIGAALYVTIFLLGKAYFRQSSD